ncbi:hypothetical protein B0H13DRAFT_1853247 [Mycena leptocephala]|nr:hypothetical protein B0H13DRAFT_1853247 [Mycena leptocephala]
MGRRGGTILAPLSAVSTSLEAQCAPRQVDMVLTWGRLPLHSVSPPTSFEFSSPPNASSHMSFSSDFDSSSRRAQETASPESRHALRKAEGHSICIKAEKIVGDRGPKGMRDGIANPRDNPRRWEASPPQPVPRNPALLTPADYSGFRSDVDPRSHVDIGEPRPEVWTYFRGNLRVFFKVPRR